MAGVQCRLEARAAQADTLLAHVKQQVKTLRQEAVQKAIQIEEDSLINENEVLRAEVAQLKKQLVEAEINNGTPTLSQPSGVVKSSPVEIAVPSKHNTTTVQPSPKQSKQPAKEQSKQPAKQQSKQPGKNTTDEKQENASNCDKEHYDRARLFQKLSELGIDPVTIEHPPAFTVDQMMEHVKDVPWAHCKNLFLKDKKKKLWLLSAMHDADVKLGDIGKKVNAPNMRLADESILYDKLGVKQGCVNAFALINDKDKNVKFLLDESVISGKYERVSFHPMDNSATTGVTPTELKTFLSAVGHEPILVNFD